MNIKNIHLMYEYNYWASGKILSAATKVTREQLFTNAEFPFRSLHGTLLHLLDGERLWRGSITAHNTAVKPPPSLPASTPRPAIWISLFS